MSSGSLPEAATQEGPVPLWALRWARTSVTEICKSVMNGPTEGDDQTGCDRTSEGAEKTDAKYELNSSAIRLGVGACVLSSFCSQDDIDSGKLRDLLVSLNIDQKRFGLRAKSESRDPK